MLLWGKKSLKCTTYHLKPVLQSSSILSIMLPILKCTLIQPVHCELHVFLSIKTVEYIQSTLGQLRCVFLLRRLRTGLTFFHFNQVLLKQTLAFLFILLFMFRCGEWECVFSTVCLVHVCISQCVFSLRVSTHVHLCFWHVFALVPLCCQCIAVRVGLHFHLFVCVLCVFVFSLRKSVEGKGNWWRREKWMNGGVIYLVWRTAPLAVKNHPPYH